MKIIDSLKNRYITHDYCICYRKKSSNKLIDLNSPFTIINSNKNFWYADPFVIDIDNKSYIFSEQYEKKKHIGCIAVQEITNNKVSNPVTIIKEPFHMSFPNVFLFDGEYYMIPETSADKSIRIYKMLDTPYKWTCVKRYDFENAVDVAVLKNNDSLILIITIIKKENELYSKLVKYEINNFPNGNLIFKSSLYDGYELNTRNGGNIISINNDLYRIAQNSTKTYYGKSLSINKCTINKEVFNESKIQDINIEDLKIKNKQFFRYKYIGTHTYNSSDKYEVIDISAFKAFGNTF